MCHFKEAFNIIINNDCESVMKFQASQYLFFCKLMCVWTPASIFIGKRKLILLLYLNLCFSCSDDKFRARSLTLFHFHAFTLTYSHAFSTNWVICENLFHVHSIMHFNGNICMFIISLAVKTLKSFIAHIAPLNLHSSFKFNA